MQQLNMELYNNLLNMSYALIIASLVVILVTMGSYNDGSISGTIGGYSGILAGILFIVTVNLVNASSQLSMGMLLSYMPFVIVMVVCCLMIAYLSIYFDKLSHGHVANYYDTFSKLSVLFLFIQVVTLMNSTSNGSQQGTKLLSNNVYNLTILLGTINIIFVVIIGIVLKFYTTQG